MNRLLHNLEAVPLSMSSLSELSNRPHEVGVIEYSKLKTTNIADLFKKKKMWIVLAFVRGGGDVGHFILLADVSTNWPKGAKHCFIYDSYGLPWSRVLMHKLNQPDYVM